MYFVIQVTSRTEYQMMEKIKRIVSSSFYDDIFIPTRIRQKKIKGKWIDYEDRLFPGYLFVETDKPKELARELRQVYEFTKLLGVKDNDGIHYIPLTDDECLMIDRLLGRTPDSHNSLLPLSEIVIEEGRQIKVISGPLLGFEGKVVKYDLHKRIAIVDMNFAGTIARVNLGIDVIFELKN